VLLIQLAWKALAFSAYLTFGKKFLNVQRPFFFPEGILKFPGASPSHPETFQLPARLSESAVRGTE